VLILLAAPDDPRSWEDIPGVALVGVVIGIVLLVAAVRAMFGRRNK
jgi:hypothetical protein